MANELEFGKPLSAHETPIAGLTYYDIPVHGDNRGWFKENWQREKMAALGLPDFGPVQNNISFNAEKGVTRGIHAEPWDKYISIATGRVFGAWVDLRENSTTYGKSFTLEIDPSVAIFVPRGVGNSFQALEDGTAYTYLVNDHWSAEAQSQYTFLNLADETVNIAWPIPLEQAELSDKDKAHPHFADVVPMPDKKILVTGANGQLGKALRTVFPDAEFAGRDEFNVANADLDARNWKNYKAIINAAAYTAVDQAETNEGRRDAWQINATGVQQLARIARENRLTLVHISSDYVFDGTFENHPEDEQFSPLGVYGQTKAAGDLAAATAPQHYIVRTSWVVGDGNNFVKTMKSLAERGVKPSVVDDQIGRLSFTSTIAAGIKFLLDTRAEYGTYNLTNDGEPASWAEVAKRVYELTGHSADDVTPVSTDEYYAGKEGIAPRPLKSTLDLTKMKKAGFSPPDWQAELTTYLENLKEEQ